MQCPLMSRSPPVVPGRCEECSPSPGSRVLLALGRGHPCATSLQHAGRCAAPNWRRPPPSSGTRTWRPGPASAADVVETAEAAVRARAMARVKAAAKWSSWRGPCGARATERREGPCRMARHFVSSMKVCRRHRRHCSIPSAAAPAMPMHSCLAPLFDDPLCHKFTRKHCGYVQVVDDIRNVNATMVQDWRRQFPRAKKAILGGGWPCVNHSRLNVNRKALGLILHCCWTICFRCVTCWRLAAN